MRLWILFRIVNDNLVVSYALELVGGSGRRTYGRHSLELLFNLLQDGNGNGAGSRRLAELVTFVKTEGPKLPSRLFAQVGDAINAFDTAIASTNQTNSNSTPFITGTQQREAAVGEVVTVTPFTAPLTGGPSDKPFTRTSSFESDTASLVAAVEARRRQLEAELAALPARQPSQTVEVFPEIGLNQKSE